MSGLGIGEMGVVGNLLEVNWPGYGRVASLYCFVNLSHSRGRI